ncbi:MAG: WG repeat-containing protein [Cetobacterium sp.]
MKKIKVIFFIIFLIVIGFILTVNFYKKFDISSKAYEDILILDKKISFLKENNKYFYKNKDNEELLKYKKISRLSNKYAKGFTDNWINILDSKNKVLCSIKAKDLLDIYRDRFILVETKNDKFYYYDLKNKKTICKEYDKLGPFDNGITYFLDGEKIGFIDTTGKIINSDNYSGIKSFSNGSAVIIKKNGKCSYMDSKGKISKEEYDDIKILKNNQLIGKRNDINYILADEYSYLTDGDVTYLADNYFLIFNNKEYKILNIKNNKIVKTFRGTYLGVDKNTLFYKNEDEVIGYNFLNNRSIHYPFDNIEYSGNNYIIGIKDGETALYNLVGKKISENYKLIFPKIFNSFIVGSEDGYGVINSLGNIEVKPIYENIIICPNGIIAEKNGKMGVLNKKDEVIIPFEYEKITYVDNYIFLYSKGLWKFVSFK